MDDPLYENYLPDYDELDELLTSPAPTQAQAVMPEPTGRSGGEDIDAMLNSLLLELGDYSDYDIAPADDEAAPEDEPAPDYDPDPEDEPAPAEMDDESDEPDEPPEDEHEHRILGADENPEDEPELESAYIRRVARRETRRAARAEEQLPPDDTPEPQPDAAETESSADFDDIRERHEHKPNFAERLAGPLIRFLATQKARQKLREQEASTWPTPVDIRQMPELPPRKAARYYGSQVYPLGTRLIILVFLTLVLAWIGFRFPLAGQLRRNIPMQAAVSLVFLLTAMLCALDVVSTGLRQIFRLQPGLQALCAASCLAGCLDALLVTLGIGTGLPFCAAASASLAAALWGAKLECQAQSINLATAAHSRENSILSAEEEDDGLYALVRSDRAHGGIVRRSEEPDCVQNAYAAAAPILLFAAPLLAILSTLGHAWSDIFHNLSAYLAVCAGVSGFLGFALPYFLAVLRFRQCGAAIAGWPGCADIGRSHRVILTDSDLFPPGSIELNSIAVYAGVTPEKVVSWTVSVLRHSGSSVADAFSDLMEHKKYSLVTVEDFSCHDAGGFSAYIHNENILVGSQGFMNLMGIRLPAELQGENSICVAISNELVGVFDLVYKAAPGVRRALDLLLLGRVQPVFAVRDFNITPLTIQKIYDIPAINFEFPSFRERYRLSHLFGRDETPPSAVLLRPNARCAVETADYGRRLYTACIAAAALSLLGVVLGLLLVFLNLRNGSGAIGTGRLLLYSLAWVLPIFGLGYWTVR